MSAILAETDSPLIDDQPAPQPATRVQRSLVEAVAAVSEHCLQTELRRLKAVQARIEGELRQAARDTLAARAPRRFLPKVALRPRAQARPPLQSR